MFWTNSFVYYIFPITLSKKNSLVARCLTGTGYNLRLLSVRIRTSFEPPLDWNHGRWRFRKAGILHWSIDFINPAHDRSSEESRIILKVGLLGDRGWGDGSCDGAPAGRQISGLCGVRAIRSQQRYPARTWRPPFIRPARTGHGVPWCHSGRLKIEPGWGCSTYCTWGVGRQLPVEIKDRIWQRMMGKDWKGIVLVLVLDKFRNVTIQKESIPIDDSVWAPVIIFNTHK